MPAKPPPGLKHTGSGDQEKKVSKNKKELKKK